MKNRFRNGSMRIIAGLVLFLVVALIVGILMQQKMNQLLQNYMEIQVTRQAEVLAEVSDHAFEAELDKLEYMAKYVSLDKPENTKLQKIEENVTYGLMELNGNAVFGEALGFTDYSGIQEAFRGNRAVCSKNGVGLLFTVPVYNGDNVKYVLYKKYDDSVVNEIFGLNCYEGRGRVLITERNGKTVVEPEGWSEKDRAYLIDGEAKDALTRIDEEMNVSIAAAALEKNHNTILFAAEMTSADMVLVGQVPEEVLAEGFSYIVKVVLWVFGLLMVLFSIGVAYLLIAEKKVQESEELREAKDMAEKASRAKSDFLANMSHEIRTPINAILGMNEMVLRESRDEEIREYAVNIQSASQTLLALINDILDFSKIEAGKMQIVENTYHLSSVLNDIANMIHPKSVKKGLTFEIEVEQDIPNVLLGDEVRIRQIVLNILNNAVKYTQKGSVHLIVAHKMEDDRTVLKFEVKDTGIGIREEDIDKLYQDFERLDLEKNRNIEGTGLGLAITHKLLEQMQGKMEVTSVYGEGSTFTIYLPQEIVKRDEIGDFKKGYDTFIQNQNRQEYSESFVAEDARILVVDDNEMNLAVVEKLLKKTRIQIDTCISGFECLERVKEIDYDVILLDHMMPEMNGIETLHKIRKMESGREQKNVVIALTANAILGVKEMYLKEGFQDYLSKPIDGKKLERMLSKYIPEEKQIKAQIPCLDVELGMQYSGDSEEIYGELLKIFCEMKEEKQESLNRCVQNEDWENYTIQIHSLKSTSLSIGGRDFSELALKLEKAGEKKQIDYILQNHEKVMKKLDRLVNEGWKKVEELTEKGE